MRFAPDDSHLLLSMCHVCIYQYCRIAKYHFADKRWEVLPHEEHMTYIWPTCSPDGKRVLFWGRLRNPIQHVFELDLKTRAFKQLTKINFDRTESGPESPWNRHSRRHAGRHSVSESHRGFELTGVG